MRPVDATSDADEVVLEGTGRPPRGRLRRVFGDFVLPIAFTLLLIVFVWRERDRLEPLTHAAIAELVLLAVLVAVTHFLNSSEFWLLYRGPGCGLGAVRELVPVSRQPARQSHSRAGRHGVPAALHARGARRVIHAQCCGVRAPTSSRRWRRRGGRARRRPRRGGVRRRHVLGDVVHLSRGRRPRRRHRRPALPAASSRATAASHASGGHSMPASTRCGATR